MSSSFCFHKENRLLQYASFQQVLKNRKFFHFDPFVLYYLKRNQTCFRLGLLLPKRHVRRAVDRNQIKRWAREWFRLNQEKLSKADYVLLVRSTVVLGEQKKGLKACLEQGLSQSLIYCKKF